MTAATCTNTPAMKRTVSPLTWISGALKTKRERHALAKLDQAALEDIGVSYHEAAREASRPIWDVPSHWLR